VNDLLELWGTLLEKPVPWGAKLLDVNTKLKQYAALSNDLRPAFISRGSLEPPSFSAFDSVQVSKVQELSGHWKLVIELLNNEYLQEFAVLCSDLRASIGNSSTEREAHSAQWSAYEDWLDFYKRSRKFSLESARGLFGELMLLNSTLRPTYGWSQSLEAWQGPHGGPHDFVLPGFIAFEVKTVQPSNSVVKISSENQLAFDGDLTLVIYRLLGHSNGSGGITLVELVQDCLQDMNASEAQLFRSKLSRIGFSESDSIATSNLFEVETPKFFNVQHEAFPKIIAKGLPSSISKVTYSISIPQLAPFELPEARI
jgi:hypothetical protein